MALEPSWLPPLNSHNDYDVYVKASQPGQAVYDPSLPRRKFTIKIKVSVNFYSDDYGSKERMFEGLCTEGEFSLYCHDVSDLDWISSWEILTSMLDKAFIPFDLDDALWRERQLDSSSVNDLRTCCRLSNYSELIAKISRFLYCMKLRNCNALKNRLPFKLEIEKKVTVPDEELAAWNSWYEEKKRSHPNFERDFREAIRRPRTYEEQVSEAEADDMFRGANKAWIQELEAAAVNDHSIPSGTHCPICLEGFPRVSEAVKLPCSHIFHRGCILNWLRASHMCPLCRFTLPTH